MQMVTAANHVTALLRLQLMRQQKILLKKLLQNLQEILLTLQPQSRATIVARQQPDHFFHILCSFVLRLTRSFQQMISMASP